jgi:hypothetical protein
VDSKNNSDAKGCLVFTIILILVTSYGIYDYKERAKEHEARKREHQEWLKTSAGQDFQAKYESFNGKVVRSSTGNLFYRGQICRDDCSGHIAGYDWAMEYGITNRDVCEEADSLSFSEGCLTAVDDIISEIENNHEDHDF